jgi:uncharacterized protein
MLFDLLLPVRKRTSGAMEEGFMPTHKLRQVTDRSNLEAFRKEAKRWLRALRAGEAQARRRFDDLHPSRATVPSLRDVQQALAREHGLESWMALREAIEDAAVAARSHQERVADFLELASLHYGVAPGARTHSGYPEGPLRRRQAARILARHPEVGRASLHTAVVCGAVDEVKRILAAKPSTATETGGREGWDPLLFLCYGRLPLAAAADNAVEIATILLDSGADPNSSWSYQWGEDTMVWSALCGVIGDGEGGPVNCPPHPAAGPLAALLLDRGAEPNQSQALYNTMLRGDDDRWLRVLIERGLGAQLTVAWRRQDPPTMFGYLLDRAVEMNQVRRATTLLEHGANPNPTSGRSLYERALLGGSVEMAELLARHGARRSELTGREAFRGACMRLDRAAAEQLLAGHPEYLEDGAAMLVDVAANQDRSDLARLLLALGVSPDAEYQGPAGRYRALHQAACLNHVGVARFLIDHGANPDARDEAFQATPLGWAIHTQMLEAIELFARHTRDVFTLVAGGLTARLTVLLAEDRNLANQMTDSQIGLGILGADAGETPLFALPDDEDTAVEVAEVLLAAGADPGRRNQAGQTPADKARARGLTDVAEMLAGKGA